MNLENSFDLEVIEGDVYLVITVNGDDIHEPKRTRFKMIKPQATNLAVSILESLGLDIEYVVKSQ